MTPVVPEPSFNYVVHRWEDDKRGYGVVVAALNDGTEVGTLTFGCGPDERSIRTTQYEVDVDYQRQGCATGMRRALGDAYPGYAVLRSEYPPSDSGAPFLQNLDRLGL